MTKKIFKSIVLVAGVAFHLLQLKKTALHI